MKKLKIGICSLVAAAVVVGLAEDVTVVYDVSFASTGSRQNVDATDLGLSVNLPGGSWIWNGGWNWAPPALWATWDNEFKDSVFLSDEFGAICLPLASAGDYVKPTRLTLEADMYEKSTTFGLGFWPSVTRVADVGDTKAFQRFTGVAFDVVNKELRVYEGGTLKGQVKVDFAETTFQHLSYTVNTETGLLEFILWNGNRVVGLESSAFTDEVTAYVGFTGWGSDRGYFKNLKVTSGVSMPQAPALTVDPVQSRAFPGDTVTIETRAAVVGTDIVTEVTVKETDCEDYAMTDGVFTWRATEPGEYRVLFESVNGEESSEVEAKIKVYAVPEGVPNGARAIIRTAFGENPASVTYAGSTRPDAEDATDYGLAVNLPGGTWYWNTGYDWAPPGLENNNASANVGNERGSVFLPLASTESYEKPRRLYVTASFTATGAGRLGFWSQKATEDEIHEMDHHFTGIAFNSVTPEMKGIRDGVTLPTEYELPIRSGQQTASFRVDLKAGKIYDLVWNGWPIDGFEIGEVTDAMTGFIGLGTGLNMGINSRLRFESLEVYDVDPHGFTVIVR